MTGNLGREAEEREKYMKKVLYNGIYPCLN